MSWSPNNSRNIFVTHTHPWWRNNSFKKYEALALFHKVLLNKTFAPLYKSLWNQANALINEALLNKTNASFYKALWNKANFFFHKVFYKGNGFLEYSQMRKFDPISSRSNRANLFCLESQIFLTVNVYEICNKVKEERRTLQIKEKNDLIEWITLFKVLEQMFIEWC